MCVCEESVFVLRVVSELGACITLRWQRSRSFVCPLRHFTLLGCGNETGRELNSPFKKGCVCCIRSTELFAFLVNVCPPTPFQELELLGEDAVPHAFYTPREDEDEDREFEAAEAGTQTARKQGTAENASGLEAKVVEMDGLGLEPEKKRDVEAVPAVGEADV